MVALCRLPRWAMLGAFLLAWPLAGLAQEESSDRAQALLQRGIEQFESLEFQSAKATLLQADRQFLSEDQQARLDYYLSRVDEAVKKQAEALEAFQQAEQAVEAGQFQQARDLFAIAAASEYIIGSKRQQARDQMAQAELRMRAAAAEAQQPPEAAETAPAVVPQPPEVPAEPVTAPTPQPVEPPAPKPQEAEMQRLLEAARQRREQAMDFLARGKAAMAQGQYEQAAAMFDRALVCQPDLQEAQKLLTEARQYTATGAGTGILPRYIERMRVLKQQADVELEKLISQVREALVEPKTKEDFQAAENAVQLAKELLETKKRLYTADEFSERMTRVEKLDQLVKTRRAEWDKAEALRQKREVEEAERRRIEQIRLDRQAKIQDFTAKASNLIAEHNYSQALDLVEQILQLEPKNTFALSSRGMLRQLVLIGKESGLIRQRKQEEQESLVEIRDAEIPWSGLLRYSHEWKELSRKRPPFSLAEALPERDREVQNNLAKLVPAPVQFEKLELTRVIDFLQEIGAVNIVVNWPALESAQITRQTQVDLRLANVSLEKVLRTVLDQVGGGITELGYMLDEGVITVSTKEDLRRTTFTTAYDIRDMIYSVQGTARPQGMGVSMGTERAERRSGDRGRSGDRDRGGTTGMGLGWPGMGGTTGTTTGTTAAQAEASRAQLVQQIVDTIKETVDPQSWMPVGTIGSIREFNGQLIVKQTAENHKLLLDLINKLREARAIQIAIEARFITVSTGFLNAIGVDLDFYFNLGTRLGSGQTTDPWLNAAGLSPRIPTAVGTSGWGTRPPSWPHLTPLPLRQDTVSYGGTRAESAILSGVSIGSVTPTALSIFGTFLDDIQVDFLLQATQAHSETRTLAAPRITLFNGLGSQIFVGTTRSYVASIEPVLTENVVAYDPEIEETGTFTMLWVEPTVSADRRYVTISIVPTVNKLERLDWFPYDPLPLIQAGMPVPVGQSFIQLPTVTQQSLVTVVSVPDRSTLLIGGQKLSAEVENEMGVPVLSKIPVVNRFFSNRNFVRDESTLLILVKPRIIIQREEEEAAFP